MRTEQGVAVTGQMPAVPIFIADLVPRCHSFVWGASDRTPSWHPGCALGAPGTCLGVTSSTQSLHNNVNALISIHSSIWKKKKAGLRALRYFPLAKQIVLHVKSEISEILIFLPLLREWEGSLVFIPPDKTGCLLGWQIARIAGFDPETGEIKEEKKKLYDSVVFCEC